MPLKGLVELPQRNYNIAKVKAKRLGLNLYYTLRDIGYAELNVVDKVGVDYNKYQLENLWLYNRLE